MNALLPMSQVFHIYEIYSVESSIYRGCGGGTPSKNRVLEIHKYVVINNGKYNSIIMILDSRKYIK